MRKVWSIEENSEIRIRMTDSENLSFLICSIMEPQVNVSCIRSGISFVATVSSKSCFINVTFDLRSSIPIAERAVRENRGGPTLSFHLYGSSVVEASKNAFPTIIIDDNEEPMSFKRKSQKGPKQFHVNKHTSLSFVL